MMFGLVTETETISKSFFFKSTVTEKNSSHGNFDELVGKQQTNNFLPMA